MTTHAEESFEVFSIESNRPDLIGESYLIAAAHHAFGGHWFGEQYLLLERPVPRLERGGLQLAAGNLWPGIVVNAAFVIERIQSLASSALMASLLKRVGENNQTNVLSAVCNFVSADADALKRCCARGLYRAEIVEMSRYTQNRCLAAYFASIEAN